MNKLRQLKGSGVCIWLDDLSRELLESGELRRLIQGSAVTGATSNPTIFAKAITGSDRYDEQLQALLASGTRDPRRSSSRSPWRTFAVRPISCAPSIRSETDGMGSSRSNARQTSPTMPNPRSSRRSRSAIAWTGQM